MPKRKSGVAYIFDAPSAQASVEARADYLELLALRDRILGASEQSLIEITGRGTEQEAEGEATFGGVEAERELETAADDAFSELQQRIEHLGSAADYYPFEIKSDRLQLRANWSRKDDGLLYVFCLLATRLNMQLDREHDGLNGTELFEEVCLYVAWRYFGGSDASKVGKLLFGTARRHLQWSNEKCPSRNHFGENVNELCQCLGEGSHFRPKDPIRQLHPQDDKLDVVVWRPFSDGLPGKLIAFGQCKTGSNWPREISQLQPESFCKNWMHNTPPVPFVRLFFVSARVSNSRYYLASYAGIFFDRCRLLEFADELPEDLKRRCRRWVIAALRKHGVKL